MAYLKLMMDEKEIAHLSDDGQYLCANEGVPQYDLPLNLFIGNSRKVPLVDVVVWVTTPEQAKIAEAAGACAVMALERIPADIRAAGGVSRMSDILIMLVGICLRRH